MLSTGKMTPRYIKANFRWGQLKYSQQTSSSWSQDCALAKLRSRILNNKINLILCSAALQQFGCDYVDCFCYLLYWRQRPYCSLGLLSQGDDGGMTELPKLGFLRVYGCYPQTHSRGISPRVSSRGNCYIFISYDHLEAELHVHSHKSSQEKDSAAFWQRHAAQKGNANPPEFVFLALLITIQSVADMKVAETSGGKLKPNTQLVCFLQGRQMNSALNLSRSSLAFRC